MQLRMRPARNPQNYTESHIYSRLSAGLAALDPLVARAGDRAPGAKQPEVAVVQAEAEPLVLPRPIDEIDLRIINSIE